MADSIRLIGLALAIVEAAAELIRCLTAKPVAGIPEVCGSRLVSHIAQHLATFSVLDFPENLAAKLKIVALLID